jgi:hypothetical protein
MRKPGIDVFEAFSSEFQRGTSAAGKEQYLIPYFIASHPGCDLPAMIELAQYLKKHNLRPDKVQDFIPLPMDVATCMYYTGLDPETGETVYVPRGGRERRLQRALLQYFKPENYADVQEALIEADRQDLIGDDPDCLIPSRQPGVSRTGNKRPLGPFAGKRAGGVSREKGQSGGYRPHRKTAKRRRRPS